MEFRDYIRIFKRRWRSVIALVVLGVLVALAFTLATSKVYAAQSKVYVKLAEVTPSSAYQANQYVLALMPSYAELNGSPQVLDPVIAKLGLHETSRHLASEVTIANPASTVYLNIDVSASSPTKAKRIANATGAQLASVIEDLQRSETSDRVVIARPQAATGGDSAVSPKLSLDLALGFLVGLVLGLIVAVVRSRLDTSIKTAQDLHELTGVPPLAELPTRTEGDVAFEPVGVDVAGDADGVSRVQLSAYRGLRTDLALASGGHLPPSVVVVASDSSDGPEVATGLALVAARSGVKTCLVEADLRHPRLAAVLSARKLIGLTAVLEGRADLADAVYAWPVGTDRVPAVVVAGEPADDPGDLLDSASMAHVHRVLAANFDLVLYVSPPAQDGSDAAILARDATAAMVVVRAGHSARARFAETAESLAAVGATVAGAVLVQPVAGGRRRRHAAGRADLTPLTDDLPVRVPLDAVATMFTPSPGRSFVPPGRPEGPVPKRQTADWDGAGRLPGLPPRARSSRRRRLLESTIPEPVDLEPVDLEPV
ncbi:Wzz/FepE/Etk N-terminal domain-containing protein, partial [Jatrophihabitans endophyticus]|uniref:Wzz/FepE/Etk N-terminal domain-containing protein n=1 Tax=Jatrophihabitans endophyticus TaxID=1206085 RepID=UPI001A04B547